MSLLSEFEDRVGRAVEGLFAGVFRAPVQPAELARAATKEMERRKKLGVGKVYVPTVYSVLLSPEDGEQLGGFADTLAGELETYLAAYAREHDYSLATRPRVRFLVDEELKLGRFEVIGELLSPDEIASEMGAHDDAAAETHAEPPRATAMATITVPGISHDVALVGDHMVMGRLKSCEIHLQDVNASREHAKLEREGSGWVLEDLNSTNGTLVNGKPATRIRLADGDVITVGVTELVFHEPRS